MSTTKLSREYKCWNDCVPQGCPGHIATLEFQSTADSLVFDDGKGQSLWGNPIEFGILLSMVNELSGSRVEIEHMIERAGKENL